MKPGRRSDVPGLLLALIAGALQPLAFAPFAFYPLAIVALLPLFALWLEAPPRKAALVGLCYGLGMFGVGISWVFVAIHVYGQSIAPVAAALTFLFVLVMSLYPALAGYLVSQLRRRRPLSDRLQLLLVLPATWTLVEWLRGWFLTGFPWLSLGYSQIDSPLRGYAPLLGVYGISLLCALSAGLLLLLWRERGRALPLAAVLLLLVWGGGEGLARIQWVTPLGEPVRVTLIQGNVPQSTKWQPGAVQARLVRYASLTERHLASSDLIIWPENAITVFYHSLADDYFAELEQELRRSNTDLILGVPLLDEDGRRYYTTMMSLGTHHAFYRKRHLVPFGEYLPFETLLRGLINFFDMPMSSFSPGGEDEPVLLAAGQRLAASVCYEDAFAAEMRGYLPQASLLVNGSNNAWYGDSLAPHQHLQISRMRALEFGRPMLRATTNGISAIIEPDGTIAKRSRQFEVDTVSAAVQPMQGATPYARVGDIALLLLLGALSGLALLSARRAG